MVPLIVMPQDVGAIASMARGDSLSQRNDEHGPHEGNEHLEQGGRVWVPGWRVTCEEL